jgi:nucleoside-diphosphate-sugar epimerase
LRALGFAPRISFEQGLTLTATWYDANAHLNPYEVQDKVN